VIVRRSTLLKSSFTIYKEVILAHVMIWWCWEDP